jgi:hypothetical protein
MKLAQSLFERGTQNEFDAKFIIMPLKLYVSFVFDTSTHKCKVNCNKCKLLLYVRLEEWKNIKLLKQSSQSASQSQ